MAPPPGEAIFLVFHIPCGKEKVPFQAGLSEPTSRETTPKSRVLWFSEPGQHYIETRRSNPSFYRMYFLGEMEGTNKRFALHFDPLSGLQDRVSLKDWFLISQPSQSPCRKSLPGLRACSGLSLGLKDMVCTFYFWNHSARLQKTSWENVFKGTSLPMRFCLLTLLTFMLYPSGSGPWTNDVGPHYGRSHLRITVMSAQQTWLLALGEKVFLICQNNDFSVFSAGSQCDPARAPHPSVQYVVLGVLPRFNFSISQREIPKQHSFM